MKLEITRDENLCVRSLDSGDQLIEGYGAVFDKPSKLLSEKGKVFYEHINRNAFDEALVDSELNVIMNRDHDDCRILARTRSGTLSLSVDDYGLKYSFVPPNTELGRETVELVKRGDLDESSFRFTIKPSDIRWWRENGELHREILKVSSIEDCSIVTEGAYADTDISVGVKRSLAEFEAKEEELKEARNQELREYYNKLKIDFYGFR